MSFTVAIIGRPNVGKSTLFNRLVGKRLALVDDTPGVTRDRRIADARIGDLQFQVIDTAGLEEATDDSLEGRMREQTEIAIREADVSLFLIDAKTGVTPSDKCFGQLLRKHSKKVVLVANKMEGKAGETGLLRCLFARIWRAGANLCRARCRHGRSLQCTWLKRLARMSLMLMKRRRTIFQMLSSRNCNLMKMVRRSFRPMTQQSHYELR